MKKISGMCSVLPLLCVLIFALFGGLGNSFAATFSNPSPIQILDNTNANPYPSGIFVEGVAGRITSATASIVGLSHAFIVDLDILLVAPSGETVVLMGRVGGGCYVSNVDLTFADSGASLPSMGQVSSGTYRPTQYGTPPVFLPPAPSPPYGNMLSVLTNQNPNGAWRLFVRDHAPLDTGVVNGGWSFTIVTEGDPPGVAALSSFTAEEGSNVSLPARATGASPLSYQWYLNGSNVIAGGTRSVLQLLDVQPTNAGTYHVVVMNTFGAVTSTPAMLSVIPPVERSLAPGLLLTADPGTDLHLESWTSPAPSSNWAPLATVRIGGVVGPFSQWYFDGLTFPAGQRFYQVWHDNDGSIIPGLELHPVPVITLKGAAGNSVWIDYINQVGPTDAWAQLATVKLTNNSQPYFDTSAVGQPPRLYRLTPTFFNLDFERAMAAMPGYPARVGLSQAFPGWTGSEGAVQYDYTWLDSAGISILDTNSTSPSVTGVLQGRYCACLYAGWALWIDPRYDIPAWIAQTGKIPVTAATLLFNYKPLWPAGELAVSFNGVVIPLRTVSSGIDGASVLGGDVSQFAGQVGELRITAPVRYPNNPHQLNAFIVDYIRFSASPL